MFGNDPGSPHTDPADSDNLFLMKAMLLAAGLGKRMLPLTRVLPKPAIPVLGRPIAAQILRRLAGGGVTLLYATRALDQLKPVNADQKVGVEIVRHALEWPVREIAENAGVDGAVVVGRLRESNDTNVGYEAQAGKYLDMFEAGVIDPTKVTRYVLQNAASVSGLLLTTEAMVADAPQDDAPSMPMPDMGGGMGGMGGMM